jgi:hypothetical protein
MMAEMIGFIRKLWRRHKVRAAEHRTYMDQRYVPGHDAGDATGTSWNPNGNSRL